MASINKIKVSHIINRSSIPDAEYEINPYIGCVYNCIYCYARYVQDDSGHAEPWGNFIDVKINAADLIDENSEKYKGSEIFIGSITDPYLPCEKEYRITRAILEKLVKLQPSLSIQTKSDMVMRDIDLLKKFKMSKVGMTITTLDDQVRAEIEDTAASVEHRINALKTIKSEGIDTYVFIGPLLPRITDWKEIIAETCQFTDSYVIEMLNIEGAIWPAVRCWLEKNHPQLIDRYESIYFTDNILLKPLNKLFWRYLGYPLAGFNSYRNLLYDEIRVFAAEKKVEVIFNDLLY